MMKNNRSFHWLIPLATVVLLTLLSSHPLLFNKIKSTGATANHPPVKEEETEAEKEPEAKIPTVVIDPGHGGSEEGTYGRVTGILEKDLNLDIALPLKKALLDAGYRVILTREEDRLVYQPREGEEFDIYDDLQARADLAEKHQADLFISIHADNYPQDLSVNGTAVYYSSESAKPEESKKLAMILEDRLVEAMGTERFGVGDREFYVLRKNTRPAVLVELGFLSNASDEQKLVDPKVQEKIVAAIVDSVNEYMKEDRS